MTNEGKRILEVFRTRNIRAGGLIHPAEFGDAIVWEEGFILCEAVRQALTALFADGYLIEHNAALELTEQGDNFLFID